MTLSVTPFDLFTTEARRKMHSNTKKISVSLCVLYASVVIQLQDSNRSMLPGTGIILYRFKEQYFIKAKWPCYGKSWIRKSSNDCWNGVITDDLHYGNIGYSFSI